MVIGRQRQRKTSPLLRELRRWQRQARRGALPAAPRVQRWLAEVNAARQENDPAAQALATAMRAILRLSVLATLGRLEAAVGHDRPLPAPVLIPALSGALRRDLDAALALGARVAAIRGRLTRLLTTHLAGRLLAFEQEMRASPAGQNAPAPARLSALWRELVEAERQGAPDLAPLSGRLAMLQAGQEASAVSDTAGLASLAPDSLAFLALIGQAGSLGEAALQHWTGGLIRQFAGRPGWDEFVAGVVALASGSDSGATAPGNSNRPIGSSALAPLPPSLRTILAFVGSVDRRIAGFLAGLLVTTKAVGAYATPAMPLVEKTAIQVDWIAGERDPWESGDLIVRAQAAAAALVKQGIAVTLVRGQTVSAARYDRQSARPSAVLAIHGPAGPVSMASLALFEQALPLAQRPGFLRVLVAPARPDPTEPAIARAVTMALAEPFSPATGLQLKPLATLAGPGTRPPGAAAEHPPAGALAPGLPALAAPTALLHAAGKHGTPTTVRVALDWVAGQDPWQRKDALARAEEVARRLDSRGVHLEFTRGRAVPAGRYAPAQGKCAADYTIPGPIGPVPLGDLDLLEQAIPLAQRPGLLRVLIAPAAHPGAPPAGPMSAGANYLAGAGALPLTPSRPAARAEAALAPFAAMAPLGLGAAFAPPSLAEPFLAGKELPGRETPFLPLPSRAPSPQGRRSERLGQPFPSALHPAAGQPPVAHTGMPTRVELDWIAGQDPWRQGEALERTRDVARQLEREGIRLEFVRGRAMPAEQYIAAQGRPAVEYSLPGPAGPVILRDFDLLNGAMPLEQRPGLLRVLLAPPRPAGKAAVPTATPGAFDQPPPFGRPASSHTSEGLAQLAAASLFPARRSGSSGLRSHLLPGGGTMRPAAARELLPAGRPSFAPPASIGETSGATPVFPSSGRAIAGHGEMALPGALLSSGLPHAAPSPAPQGRREALGAPARGGAAPPIGMAAGLGLAGGAPLAARAAILTLGQPTGLDATGTTGAAGSGERLPRTGALSVAPGGPVTTATPGAAGWIGTTADQTPALATPSRRVAGHGAPGAAPIAGLGSAPPALLASTSHTTAPAALPALHRAGQSLSLARTPSRPNGSGSAAEAGDAPGTAPASVTRFVSPAAPTSALPLRRGAVAMATTNRSLPVPSVTPPPSAGTVDAPGPAAPGVAAPDAPASANLDALARQVYSIIRQRLTVERERSGAARGARPW